MATGQIWLQISTCSKVVKIDENGLKIKRNQTLSAVPIFWVKKCIKFKFKIFSKEEKKKKLDITIYFVDSCSYFY